MSFSYGPPKDEKEMTDLESARIGRLVALPKLWAAVKHSKPLNEKAANHFGSLSCASMRRNRELVVGIASDSFLSGRRLIRWRGYWATQTF
jgi:hypothetical protein